MSVLLLPSDKSVLLVRGASGHESFQWMLVGYTGRNFGGDTNDLTVGFLSDIVKKNLPPSCLPTERINKESPPEISLSISAASSQMLEERV
jgi:hypothetical protein